MQAHSRPVGFTAEGSPLFPCDRRWPLRIASGSPPRDLLAVTLDLPRDYEGRFSVTMQLKSSAGDFVYRLCRPPGWKTYPVPLREILPANRALDERPLEAELSFSGEGVDALRLGEIKLLTDPGWRLKSRVQGVSFPRCGHHMLVEVLERYFGIAFRYCSYYGLCEQRPCPASVGHLQKNHDHDLAIDADGDADYLIQYRRPLGAMISQFEHRVRLGHARHTADEWRTFALDTLPQWEAFVRKWVLENQNPRAIKIAYEDVLADPIRVVGRVARFFAPDDPLDEAQLERAARRVSVRRRLEQFQHFDRKFFADLEARAAPALEALNLPRQLAA